MSEEFPWCSFVDYAVLTLLEESTNIPVVKKFSVFRKNFWSRMEHNIKW